MSVLRWSLCCLVLAACGAGWAQEGQRKVIGKLGQAVDTAAIHSTPSTRARVYYRTKPYQYLVIQTTKHTGWLGVVLENRKLGYIKAEKVAALPYTVSVPISSKSVAGGKPTSVAGSDAKAAMLNYSFNFIGTPYEWGGNSLTNGIDCSGFVKELFGKIGVNLPRTAAEQALVGQPIESLQELRQGDRLYFWDSKRGKIGHTGIFLGYREDGGAYFIHSSSGKGGVDTDDLRNPKWRNILVAARR